jgi:two-component system sensor histidine kinase KdpD
MLPFRSHLSVATTALVLVIPVVASVAVGGFPAGVAATVTGFVAYDLLFIPPYYTLAVGAAQNWIALAVYVVVMLVTAQVVAQVNAARAEAQRRATEVRRLFDVSELLVRDSSLPVLFQSVVTAVLGAFRLDSAALLLPVEGHLRQVASAGEPLSGEELEQLSADRPGPVSLESASVRQGGIQAVALATSGRGVGLLALRGLPASNEDHELLRAFANHIALALERSWLQEQAVQAQLLAEVGRLGRALVSAVSHDLRTPLSTIKVSTSTLLDPNAALEPSDAQELIGLIDGQADRLDRLVANLLDMTRIQSGTLELRRYPTAVSGLVDEALSLLGSSTDVGRVTWHGSDDLPPVDVDHVLICQVLANLIDNATRYSPAGTPVDVSASRAADGTVHVAVTDRGPGVAPDERTSIFQMLNRREAGGRGGLGLGIARAFVEEHGQRIWVEDGEGVIGARFVFTLPPA